MSRGSRNTSSGEFAEVRGWVDRKHMALRIDKPLSLKTSVLLRHCYLFVARDWQHLPRDATPDQGFEMRFRENCVQKLSGWVISQHREMSFGLGLMTASGVQHEIDIVANNDPVFGVLELKNRPGWGPEKNDVIVFFAKILDYLCFAPSVLRSSLVPILLSCHSFDKSGLAACLGLGIHPVAPYLRPLPILVDNARCMVAEKRKGVALSENDEEAFDDFCSALSKMAMTLTGVDLNSRFIYRNESTIEINTFPGVEAYDLADELQRLNGEATRLVDAFREAKRG